MLETKNAELELKIDIANEDALNDVRSNPRLSKEVALECLQKSKEIGYVLGEGKSHLILGASYLWLSEYDKAMEHCIHAKKILEPLNAYHLLGENQYTIGTIFYYLSDYNSDLEASIEALKYYEKAGDKVGVANAYNGIGSVYYTVGQNEKALDYLLKSKSICVKEKADHILQKVLDGLGQTYLNMKRYDDAEDALLQCLELTFKTGNEHVKSHCYNKLGLLSNIQGNYTIALDYFQKSLFIREQINFKNGQASSKLNIGRTYYLLQRYDLAEDFLYGALKIAKEVSAKNIESETLLRISELCETQNETEKALDYFKSYHALNEEVKSENADRRAHSLELKFKNKHEQTEKELLEEKNSQLQQYSQDLINLGEIGQSITSIFEPQKIVQTVYERLQEMMSVDAFGIGIYNAEKQVISYPAFIEKGKFYFDEYHSVENDNRLANICFKNNEIIFINDFESEYALYISEKQKPIAGETTASIIYVPFDLPNGTSGVVTVQSFKKNSYKDYHVNVLRNLSVFMLNALENAESYKALEEKVKERTKEIQEQNENLEKSYQMTALLSEVGKQLTSSTDFDTIFVKLHESVSELMDAACFGVRLYKPEENVIEYKFEIENGVIYDEVYKVSMDHDDNYSVICVKNNQVIHINDNLKEYKKYTNEIVVPSGEMPHSLIFHPMNIGNRTIGLITVQSFKKYAFDELHLSILKTLSSFTAIALDNVNILENLESKVQERTKEIVKQKEEIEKTYQNAELLKEIGRDIISSLSISEVIEKIYENTNQLMDSSIIGIGIANEKTQKIEIKGAIEEGKKLPDFEFDIEGEESLTRWCYQNGKEIIINDFDQDIHEYIKGEGASKVGKRPESIIYIPLNVKGKTLGTFSVQSFHRNAYNDYHINILRNLALYAATAIENASLYAEMEEKVAQRTQEVVKQKEEIERTYNNTRLLSKVGQEIISTHDLENIFEKLHENVNQLMDATCFSIRICDYENHVIDYRYTIEKGERLPSTKVSLDDIDNYSVWCVKNKKEIFIVDHQNEYQKYTKNIVVVAGELPESLIFCPMIVKGKVIGVISAQSFEKFAYQEYHLDVLRSLATYSAIALENASLIQNMEDEVKERTQEVVQQKEEIEKAYQNTKLLSEIGKEISAELSTKNIIEKVYATINNLMDATVFGIAVYRSAEDDLFFSGAMEKGKQLPDFSYPANDEKIAGKCFLSGEEIIINDWANEYHKFIESEYEATKGDLSESMIYLPLISNNNIIGVITVQSFDKEAYTEYHMNVIRTLSIYIANALENASLYQDLENRVKERTQEIEQAYQNIKLLSQISKDIAESLEVESIISSLYNNINNLMDASCFGIGIVEEDENRIKMPGFIENGKKMDDFYLNYNEDRLAIWCIKNEKEIFIQDYFEEYDQYVDKNQLPVKGKDSHAIIYLPLFVKDKVFGLLTVQSFKPNAFSEYHLDLLKSLTAPIATALENAKLYQNMEAEVRTRTAEVVQQKEIIEEKNKDITDSIRYAQRIQNVILPPESQFKAFFENSFVFFRPRDIVSGDFYWLEQVDNKIYLTVVDCTGHGVPGALVSLVGANGLNRCLIEFGLRKPSDILNKLSEIVTDTFAKSESDVKDGMDMALCCIDPETKILEYAGANNPLWIVRYQDGDELPYKSTQFDDLKLVEVKADKQPVGHHIAKKPFTNHTIQLLENDRIYLFSDGYADQFGGIDPKTRSKGGKKFKYSNFKKMIIDAQDLPMHEQLQIFDDNFNTWKGDFEQIDDVCLIGVRL